MEEVGHGNRGLGACPAKLFRTTSSRTSEKILLGHRIKVAIIIDLKVVNVTDLCVQMEK